MSKEQRTIWIIDVLTIVLLIITLQSIAVGFEEFFKESFFYRSPLGERILISIQLCSICGWLGVLRG